MPTVRIGDDLLAFMMRTSSFRRFQQVPVELQNRQREVTVPDTSVFFQQIIR